jgi:hypothetical protein
VVHDPNALVQQVPLLAQAVEVFPHRLQHLAETAELHLVAKRRRDEETKRRRDEETKRRRDEEAKRRRDEETKRRRDEETKRRRESIHSPG